MAKEAKSPLLKISLALVVLVGAGLYYWFGPSRTVAVVARTRSDIAKDAVSGTLIVQAAEAQEIKSEVSGRVTEMPMTLDKQVKAGDVLLQLDTGDLKLDIERLQSELGAAKKKLGLGSSFDAELQNAKDALAETLRLNSKGLASEVDVLRQKRAIQTIEQRAEQEQIDRKLAVEGIENTLKVKNRLLEKMTLRAPFDGIIAEVRTGRGDLIGTSSPIARLISISRIVEGRLSEENFAGVRPGQRAIVSFLPYGAVQFDAKIVKVLSTSDPETQRYLVHVEVDPAQLEPSKLIPGITGDLSIILAERPAKTLVPRRALVSGTVKVVENGRVSVRKVKTGFISLTAVEILEGINEGEVVIVGDVDSFHQGQSVQTENTTDIRWR